MRRGLASLIMGLSLVLASLSWAGFTLSHTVLDPGRSERLAAQLLERPAVRQALAGRLADAVEPQIPPEVPVPRSLIEAGAETAIDDPRVQALILDAVVQFHRNALEGNTDPVVLEAPALGGASRTALVAARPELDPFLPATPSLALELPTSGFTWLATVKRFVDRWTVLAALAALAGATLAFAVAHDRAAVLRRVAFWGYGAAAFWLVAAYGLPWVASALSPTSGAIAAAAVDVFLGAMIRPAIIMALVATALLGLGFVLPTLSRQRAVRTLQPTGAGPRITGPSGPRPGGGPGPGRVRAPSAPPLVPRPQPTMVATAQPRHAMGPPGPSGGFGRVSPTGSAEPSAPTGADRPPDRTQEMPNPLATGDGPGSTAGGAAAETSDRARQAGPAWREGVGYIEETDQS